MGILLTQGERQIINIMMPKPTQSNGDMAWQFFEMSFFDFAEIDSSPGPKQILRKRPLFKNLDGTDASNPRTSFDALTGDGNIIANHDFETGDFTDWITATCGGNLGPAIVIEEGTYGAQVNSHVGGNQDMGGFGEIEQVAAITQVSTDSITSMTYKRRIYNCTSSEIFVTITYTDLTFDTWSDTDNDDVLKVKTIGVTLTAAKTIKEIKFEARLAGGTGCTTCGGPHHTFVDNVILRSDTLGDYLYTIDRSLGIFELFFTPTVTLTTIIQGTIKGRLLEDLDAGTKDDKAWFNWRMPELTPNTPEIRLAVKFHRR
ncbi:MAG: hypothetical protein V3U54_12950 [Thermodesulfobacteriota bacterium]